MLADQFIDALADAFRGVLRGDDYFWTSKSCYKRHAGASYINKHTSLLIP
jgi:hypothetical protein